MGKNSHAIQLVSTDASRFDELDVARCVAQLGGTMNGRHIRFKDYRSQMAAIEVLCERFGARFFRDANQEKFLGVVA